jgi:hypothetical protein
MIDLLKLGAIAQLVERCDGIAEASGSNPLGSIHSDSLKSLFDSTIVERF